MRLTAKTFERDSKKAEKEKEKQMLKAKDCIKKNNEEDAKLKIFLKIIFIKCLNEVK